MRELAEKEAENQHRQKRLQHGPGGADRRLLVTDFDVAPDEEIEQLAKLPQFREGQHPPAAGRRDAEHRNGDARRACACCDAWQHSLRWPGIAGSRGLEPFDVLLLDAAHHLLAVGQIAFQRARGLHWNHGHLIVSSITPGNRPARRDQMRAPLKDQPQIPDDQGCSEGRGQYLRAPLLPRFGEPVEEHGQAQNE